MLLIATACATVVTQPSLPLWGALAPGQYEVGFHTAGEWYPAAGDGARMRFRDYAGELDHLEAALHEQHVSDEAIVELFDAPMYARRDAPALKETFPLAYIVKGTGQTAADFAVIAEFLASHGYVIRVADEKTKPGGKAQWLHAANASALALVARDKAPLESLANALLRYLQGAP